MEQNEGTLDRLVRIGVGLALLALCFVARTPYGLIGMVPLATGVLGVCPIYHLFGVSTCRAE